MTLLAFTIWPAAAAATTYTVTSTTDSAGACYASACPSLRAAVAAANTNPGSTIELGAGTFTLGNGAGQAVGGGELQISAAMTITGAGAASTVIKQTDGQDRVIDAFAGGPVTLDDLTITGGTLPAGASEPGAGIYTVPPMTLNGVVVAGNHETGSTSLTTSDCCQAVGAITSLSDLTINDSTITSNGAVADAGSDSTTGAAGGAGGQAVGAILATQDNPITINDSTISDNTATSGAGGSSPLGTGGTGGEAYGGIFVEDGAPLTIDNSIFSDNVATAGSGGSGLTGGTGGGTYGGGVLIPDGTLQVDASTFDGNVATGGGGGPSIAGAGVGGAGGVAMGGGLVGGSRTADNAIVNSTFDANQASAGAGGTGLTAGIPGYAIGGGVAQDVTDQISIISSTFDANRAEGPGLSYGGNLYDQPTPITLAEDIFSAGVAEDGNDCAIAATETDDGHNLESSPDECGLSAAQDDLISANPMLQPLADNGGPVPTMALGAASAAIGAGGTCLDYSQSGDPALTVDARGVTRPTPCDIGAYQTTTSAGGSGTAPGSGSSPGSAPAGSSSSGGPSNASPTVAPTSTGSASSGAATPQSGPTSTVAVPVAITDVAESATRWRLKGRSPHAHRMNTGTTFRFFLSAAANVTLTFTRTMHGRSRTAGRLVVGNERRGEHAIRFDGRLTGGRRLRPGAYEVMIEARSSVSRKLRFVIVGS